MLYLDIYVSSKQFCAVQRRNGENDANGIRAFRFPPDSVPRCTFARPRPRGSRRRRPRACHCRQGGSRWETQTMIQPEWVKLPTSWIDEKGLADLHWRHGGSSLTAALMVLIAIAHRADPQSGIAQVTYDTLAEATELSRTKIAHGLCLLKDYNIVEASTGKRSNYWLVGFDPHARWGKLPAKPLYSGGAIEAFRDFKLRTRTELDALKIYLNVVARRKQETNMAHVSYPAMEEATGVATNRIRSALSLLAALGLVHIERIPRMGHASGFAYAYRLPHIQPRRHMGTTGRAMENSL